MKPAFVGLLMGPKDHRSISILETKASVGSVFSLPVVFGALIAICIVLWRPRNKEQTICLGLHHLEFNYLDPEIRRIIDQNLEKSRQCQYFPYSSAWHSSNIRATGLCVLGFVAAAQFV